MQDPTGRPPSKFACTYWSGTRCTADAKFPIADISCFDGGLCDGFGTCRGCTKFDQGGLKLDDVNGQGGFDQTPVNLQVYNLRARMQPCCNWDGAAVDFVKGYAKTETQAEVSSVTETSVEISGPGLDEDFPQKGRLVGLRAGVDQNGDPYPKVNMEYASRTATSFNEVTFSPAGVLNNDYTVHLAEKRALPIFRASEIPADAIIQTNYTSGTGATIFVAGTNGFPSVGGVQVIMPDGQLRGTGSYSSKTLTSFNGYSGTQPVGGDRLVSTFIGGSGEMRTLCTLPQAAPWQEAFTEENPSAYGCNGAKPECPFYTGPKFTEVVDAKMDKGDRVTAIQLMELRYYSQNWSNIADDAFQDPRELWEELFDQPDIWAWAKDNNATMPGTSNPFPPERRPGRRDTSTGKPLIQRVTIDEFEGETPVFSIDPPVLPPDGTPVVGGPPIFPTLVRSLGFLSPSVAVIFPKGTTSTVPFIKKTFTPGDRFFYISFLAHTNREIVAINLTKHPQDGMADEDFIKQTKLVDPEGVVSPFISPLPGKTVKVELEYGGVVRCLNHIRIFVDTGLGVEDELDVPAEPGTFDPTNTDPPPVLPNGERRYLKLDVFVEHVFYHAHVAQTYFDDLYGHKAIDPWINHFTQMELGGQIFNLTGNTRLSGMFWNTIASDGKKSLYSVETSVEATSRNSQTTLRWQHLHCGYILVEFLDNKINRVAPWQAWGEDSKGQELYVRLDRSSNDLLTADEPVEVNYELVFASTKGTIIPANMAIFKPVGETPIRPPDEARDEVVARYAYTEHLQGPMPEEDLIRLKFPADAGTVISAMPYDLRFDAQSFDVDGCFVRAGGEKFYSCDQVLGDCYKLLADENELLARQSFEGGGSQEASLLTNVELVNECAEEFNSLYEGLLFEDGVSVVFSELVKRMQNLHLREGSQHYSFVFEDEEGRPIGVKNCAFLTQSALPQARDVEIRYKWGTNAQHYRDNNNQFMFASLYKPMFSSTSLLRYLIQPYDPFCGDHAGTEGGSAYHAFNLDIDKHGPLWYPYKRCLKPQYHADSTFFVNVVHYEDTVEGFDDELRRNYWERMRGADKYMPIIHAFNNLIGCVWSELTTTVNNNPPYVFLGYTKVRSSHPFGYYSTDRESLRVSRHWEKRNLAVNEEVLRQEDDGITIELTDEYASALYNDDGSLKTGSQLETPVWVHINDGMSVVAPATEDREHPFTHLLLERVGGHAFEETYENTVSNRWELFDIVEERDYTSRLDRSEDGTQVYLADGTKVNTTLSGVLLEVDDGRDIRWAYKKGSPAGQVAWVWMADPERPQRGEPRIGGVYLSNPQSLFFKANFVPATHTTEGEHFIEYTPHVFTANGGIETPATISMDNGPHYEIDLETGFIVIPEDGSPYDPAFHEGEDYQFRLFGQGPGGAGILADNRGLQRYTVGGQKFATLAGVNINPQIDINELPYRVIDIMTLARFQSQESKIEDLLQEFPNPAGPPPPGPNPVLATTTGPVSTGYINFQGHYYVENVTVIFQVGGAFDIPSISIDGRVDGAEIAGNSVLYSPTDYIDGSEFAPGGQQTVVFPVNLRMATIKAAFGARRADRKLRILAININIRENIFVREVGVVVNGPLANISTGNTGTHHPAELEFYFQRSFPDHSKNYLDGQVLVDRLAAAYHHVSYVPGVEIKYTGRRIKDILPHYEFSDAINIRFPYNNIDISAIGGYVEQSTPLGFLKYIAPAVQTCSKGWTMWTSEHKDDPGANLSHPEAFDKVRPFEEIQETLYYEAAGLLGDKIAVFRAFWHPKEIAFYDKVGISIEDLNYTCTLTSVIAPIDKVFRHEDYGCATAATNEYMDGFIHKVENWQARGVFHYQCDARFNYGCFTTLMNKCITYLFREFGTPAYLNNDVLGRFNYVFAFPPREYGSYIAAGLIDKNYFSGVWSGFAPTSAVAAAYSGMPFTYQFDLIYKPILGGARGPGPYQ